MIIVTTDKKDFISGTIGNDRFNIPYEETQYEALNNLQFKSEVCNDVAEMNNLCETAKQLVESYDFNKEIASGIPGVVYFSKNDTYRLDLGNGFVSDINIPESLVSLLKDNLERGLPTEPIVNMCLRFALNPKPTQTRFNMLGNYVTQTWTDDKEAGRLMEEEGLTYDVAMRHATYSDLQITAEGYLKTSKVVDEITKKWSIKLDDKGKPVIVDGKVQKEEINRYETAYDINDETGEVTERVEYPAHLEGRKFKPAIYSNGDDFYSGDVLGYKYEVGNLAALPSWDNVDMIDGQAHVRGLHTGGLRYIQGYYNEDRNEILNVFVCPSQIAKFCNDGLGEMTCKEFFIYGCATIEGTTKSLYHTSTYSKIQSATLKELVEEFTAEITKKTNALNDDVVKVSAIAAKLNSEA